MWTPAVHSVVTVYNAGDTTEQRDLVVRETLRVTAAVRPFMMGGDHLQGFHGYAAIGTAWPGIRENFHAQVNVRLDLPVFFRCQRGLFVQQFLWQAGLAYVQQQSAEGEYLD